MQLDVGEVLHFIHHDVIIYRLTVRQPLVCEDVDVIEVILFQEKQVFFKEPVHGFTFPVRKNRLFHAEREVFIERKVFFGDILTGDHPTILLEGLVSVTQPCSLPMSGKP